MSNMFDNYENLANNYIPSNLKPCYPPCPPKDQCSCLNPAHIDKPYANYDIEGNLIGYWWYYGNTLTLQFTINGEVIIDGSNEYISADDFVKNKKITMNLYNFRRELIYTAFINVPDNIDDANIVSFDIDSELSAKLVQGIYYCSLDISDDKLGFNQTILQMDQCTLEVK